MKKQQKSSKKWAKFCIKIDKKRKEVYRLWQEGKTFGIFQFESTGITNFMKELKPDCFEDLIDGETKIGKIDCFKKFVRKVGWADKTISDALSIANEYYEKLQNYITK